MTAPRIDTPCTCSFDDNTHDWNCARAIVARTQANTERLHRKARERYERQLQLARFAKQIETEAKRKELKGGKNASIS